MRKFLTAFVSIILIFSVKGISQEVSDTGKLFLIETSDGNEYVGKVLSDDWTVIRFETENIGIITIRRLDIKKMRELKREQMIHGSVWYENIQSTRYYWAPNGYGLKKGEAYYQNLWIFYNQAGYGFSDYFSVGAGVVPLFLFAGAPTPIWVTPKFSIPVVKDKVNLGAGVLAAIVMGEESTSFGIGYGVSTFGSRDKNFSLGFGYGYADGHWAKSPVVMAGTMIRTGKKGYFMSENYFIRVDNETIVALMFGGRTLIRKVAVDYGLVTPFATDLEEFIAIPWLGITIPIEAK
ncbi:MAG: hypothetical protein U0T82_08840 [Bacteroidales bacterium]